MSEFIDTHCHIHEADYLNPLEALERAREIGVTKLICVGTSENSSERAVAFAESHSGVYATIGVHPHDTKDSVQKIALLAAKKSRRVVAIGEIGLDYFYDHSPHEAQIEALKAQLQIAVDYDLPVVFHVRGSSSVGQRDLVWDDFWPIFDSFHYKDGSTLRGELHSFTDTPDNLKKALDRGLYVGLNGISTFTHDEAQKEVFRSIPLERLLLETDSPFLTPAPFRGTINEPKNVVEVAKFYAENYCPDTEYSLDDIAATTTTNAKMLFHLI